MSLPKKNLAAKKISIAPVLAPIFTRIVPVIGPNKKPPNKVIPVAPGIDKAVISMYAKINIRDARITAILNLAFYNKYPYAFFYKILSLSPEFFYSQ